MNETIEVAVGDPYHAMLETLRKEGQSDPDADIQQLVEDAIHNGYQQMQSEQS